MSVMPTPQGMRGGSMARWRCKEAAEKERPEKRKEARATPELGEGSRTMTSLSWGRDRTVGGPFQDVGSVGSHGKTGRFLGKAKLVSSMEDGCRILGVERERDRELHKILEGLRLRERVCQRSGPVVLICFSVGAEPSTSRPQSYMKMSSLVIGITGIGRA
ncbi:hypothetical protein CRG98_019018 [Punica granatum]|uniref:Uncharacterized protein n=1 Tax=Punica granatum TaxID=22663 RepID=A0A2I0JWA6_PUNGR|nr:hypothetical protein CRG98_019018 [Punica granatum]